MTATLPTDRPTRGLSPLQRALLGVVAAWFAIIPVFWYLEIHLGVSQKIASNTMTVIHVCLFATALGLPWIRLPGMGPRARSQRLDGMVIVWLFICLAPRFIWELPWLLALDQIKSGVAEGALWTYFWSPYLVGGDARYLNGDPLVVTLECIALFAGAFELYAVVRFFRQGKRFTNTQLTFIMAGMIVEVTLPAVYFGTEIANGLGNISSTTDLIIKFALLNAFWCTLPLITFAWAARRLARQDLQVTF
ncbi:hypothetical protein [Nocardioides sp. R-C-SC26]|uniref:hypothetical protein n=1 Tax=Nocardioides sp. R-C-SC26 TaxID=2870414 RepID=UPI001E28F9F8|nr:hypothetical protein [Nocardioides sp. R-C-SC26]